MGERADEYRLSLLAEAEGVGEQDVIDFWVGEGAVPPETARDRLAEVALVAVAASGEIAGVSTVFLRWSAQLQTQMWHLREFVGRDHRHGWVARRLMRETRIHLEERFATGVDTRAPGLMAEVENEEVKRVWRDAVWEHVPPGKRYFFIGENAKGDHVRVLFFDGAPAPRPA